MEFLNLRINEIFEGPVHFFLFQDATFTLVSLSFQVSTALYEMKLLVNNYKVIKLLFSVEDYL